MKAKWKIYSMLAVVIAIILGLVMSGLQKVARANDEAFLQYVSPAILSTVYYVERYIEEPNEDRAQIILLSSYRIFADLYRVNRSWYASTADKELAIALGEVAGVLNVFWWNNAVAASDPVATERNISAAKDMSNYLRSISAVIHEHFVTTSEERYIANKSEAASRIKELTAGYYREPISR